MTSDCPVNEQDRLVLDPRDGAPGGGNPVTLDPGALTITNTNGGPATFEYNPETNAAVFRPPDDPNAGPTSWLVQIDGQPGPGQSFLSVEIEQNPIPVGAVSAGASLERESKGTPA